MMETCPVTILDVLRTRKVEEMLFFYNSLCPTDKGGGWDAILLQFLMLSEQRSQGDLHSTVLNRLRRMIPRSG